MSSPIRAATVVASFLCVVPVTHVLATEVDLQLVLAADVSLSMNGAELELQKDGYVSAFRSPQLLEAIQSGPLGRIAVTYVEWAAQSEQTVIVPWTILSDAESVERFAKRLAMAPTMRSNGSGTSISDGLLFASYQFPFSGVTSFRKTIDVSGDGKSDQGPPMAWAREQVLDQHVTINGLSVVQQQVDAYNGYVTSSRSNEIHDYYQDSVIGGPGAFVISINGFQDFAQAIRRKLILEIAWRPSRYAMLGLEYQ